LRRDPVTIDAAPFRHDARDQQRQPHG
jgi:hypothetical protein